MPFTNQAKLDVKSKLNNKAIFFDRDGVLNHLVERDGGFFSPRKFDDFKLYQDTYNVIKKLKSKKYLIIIISNQPDISRLSMKEEELNKMNQFLYNQLKIDDIFYSFESNVKIDGTKKPSPKMIYEAQDKWNIDLSKSYMVGDSIADLECASNASVKFILMKRMSSNIYNDIEINNLSDLLRCIPK